MVDDAAWEFAEVANIIKYYGFSVLTKFVRVLLCNCVETACDHIFRMPEYNYNM